ncbi:class II glutamine amidotransferase [Lentisphaera profundi]|uniref:Class II glutamine amidotransferase n=1 Tax=Lentisphaera profundi TaxID=1658616 RepID=A0ABY7VPZ2_9BACT|nr:class II glutamine amidotransferase [Lentisphaera profundi]WDE95896.1 class II glutamine amidotransferase [Lentisphaera profundi]
MCQLLAMNCNTPTDICFSFEGFAQRGGLTDQHTDGWGISFFEESACRSFHDTLPAAQSPIAKLIKDYPIKALNVISHIRQATIGAVELKNTQPYQRELWGQQWVFAHNGDLWDYKFTDSSPARPIGTSDSEAVFCDLLNQLRSLNPTTEPDIHSIYNCLKKFSSQARSFGTFNFLLSNGKYIFAHCSTKLCYIVRQAPFHEAHLSDKDISINFSTVTTEDDRVAVIATEPLTDNEEWTHFEKNQLLLFKHGKVLNFE